MELLIKYESELKFMNRLFTDMQLVVGPHPYHDMVNQWGYPIYEFCIGVKDKSNLELYLQIIEGLLEAKLDKVRIAGLYDKDRIIRDFTKRDIIGPKKEYQSKIEEINKINTNMKENFEKLVNQLEKLGCHCTDLTPEYQLIDIDWYNLDEYIDISDCCISVYYHQKTEFYEFIKSSGLLDRI